MEPQVISDQAFPLLAGSTQQATGSNTTPVVNDSGAEIPKTHVDVPFPSVVVAQETISQSLNTETKRILADYTFESLGAFSVYSKIHPLAHISMSGDGIVGIDANGNTSFSIDGETGDATFKGTVQAGSLISGSLVLGGAGNGDGTLVVLDSSSANLVALDNTGIQLYQQTSLQFIDPMTGTLGYFGPFNGAIWLSSALTIPFNMQAIGGSDWYFGSGPGYAGNLAIHGNFSVTGTKSAKVNVDGEDILFYALESPRDTWFFDFAKDLNSIDEIFMKATEGDIRSITTNEGELLVFRKRKAN